MFKTISTFAILATLMLVVTDSAFAKRSLRFANSSDDAAPVPGVAAEHDGNLAAIDPADARSESDDAAASEGYILHCCPPPRGYTPIKCDPNAYNCFRAMRGSSRFPYRFRPGG